MGTRSGSLIKTLAFGLLLTAAGASASPFDFAEHTPGYRLATDASRFYENGSYFTARHRFKQAAYWGDKLAQHNVGAMYYRGDGVERDPVRAWAWFELAAERDYPEFVAVANAVRSELDERQRQEADALLEELRAEYGDEVAVPRTRQRMERERRRMTGTRTGSVGRLTVIDGRGTHDAEQYFAEEKWDFDWIVRHERQVFDALARANVSIGPLQLVDDDETDQSGQDPDPPEGEPAP